MISAVTTEADSRAVKISRKVQLQQNMKISEYWYVEAWGLLFPKQEGSHRVACPWSTSAVCVLAE